MDEPKSKVNRFYARLKRNPVIATLILLGSVTVALSSFTNATSNLLGLVEKETRPNINGVWRAEVSYDWPGADYSETFDFKGEGSDLYGTVSFLETKRGILKGEVKQDQIDFTLVTQEVIGSRPAKDSLHRYRGKIFADKITFVLQTSGGYSSHVPVEFVAVKVAEAVEVHQ